MERTQNPWTYLAAAMVYRAVLDLRSRDRALRRDARQWLRGEQCAGLLRGLNRDRNALLRRWKLGGGERTLAGALRAQHAGISFHPRAPVRSLKSKIEMETYAVR